MRGYNVKHLTSRRSMSRSSVGSPTPLPPDALSKQDKAIR
jgi:hypothetical protein